MRGFQLLFRPARLPGLGTGFTVVGTALRRLDKLSRDNGSEATPTTSGSKSNAIK